jgi:hypothetical protein
MTRTALDFIRVVVVTTSIMAAGCASPIKPAVLDVSGGKIREAAVEATFSNPGGNQKLALGELRRLFPEVMQREGSTLTNGAMTIVPSASGAAHVITVQATIVSATSEVPGFYNACAWTDKQGRCQGSWTPSSLSLSRTNLRVKVMESKTGKVIFQSDDRASGTVGIDDRSPASAAQYTARAALKALKDSGLL